VKSIAFRVDSGRLIGSGHVSRCTTLAKALRNRGAEVSFICRRHIGAMIDWIRGEGFPVDELPEPICPPAEVPAADWNGVPMAEDASQTIERLPPGLQWLIVDHYSCGQPWERAVRPHCRWLGVIDDVARAHQCDLLIDPNWQGQNTRSRYVTSSDSVAVMLLGPAYALISDEYLGVRSPAMNRRSAVQRVLVYFGGSDLPDLTSLTLRALSAGVFSHLYVDVVIGATASNRAAVIAHAAARPRTTIHEHKNSLAPLLAAADLAIGAVGGTTWERMFLGIPAIATIMAENQREIADALSRAGLLVLVGEAQSLQEMTLTAALSSLLGDPSRRQRMADAGQALVDGLGVDRIVDSMATLSL
jgi:UDP-2,4-diacetamido-2,4,6-trideoxy-beta-L-altropyranose hydrolase